MCDRSYDEVGVLLPNENYENDIRYTLEICGWILTPIGVRPLIYGPSSRLEQIVSVVLVIACFCVLMFALLPFGYYTLFLEEDMSAKIEYFGPLCFVVTTVLKYCCLQIRASAFGRCIKHIERDFKLLQGPEHRAIMMKNVNVSRRLTSFCAVFLYGGGLFYQAVMPFFTEKATVDNHTLRPLKYPGYDLLYDAHASPAYEITFFLFCWYVLIAGSVTTSLCGLSAVFVTHACGQIQIQIARLNRLVKGQNEEKNQVDPLQIIIDNHAKILRFSWKVEEVLREMLLLEIVESTLIICLCEFYIMTEFKNSDALAIFTYASLLTSFTFNILIFCYIGDLLEQQAGAFGTASYEIEWYKLPPKKALSLVLMIAISKYPLKLTAGSILPLSIPTFGTVLKTSVVYLNLLRTFVD